MAEILSQSEIDALLSEIESGDTVALDEVGDVRKKQVNVYDFRHPNLVSKEHLRILQMIHERFAKLVESYFTSKLRSLVDVKLIAVDQVTYSEFMLSMSDPSCIYVLRIESLNGDAVMEITLPLVFYMVDRLFGGEGKGLDKLREMTLIEQQVISRISQDILDSLKKAWSQVIPLEGKIMNYQSRPTFIQIAPLEEMVISMSLEVNVQETTGFINLCFPFQIFEDVLPKLSSQQMIRSRKIKKTGEEREIIASRLRQASVPISVHLGQKKLSLKELLELEEGDVIRLDTELRDKLTIFVEEKPKYRGTPGVYRKKLALRINEILQVED